VERLVTLVDSRTIEVHHLKQFIDEETQNQQVTFHSHSLIDEAKDIGRKREKEIIIDALKEAAGNKKKAAEILGIHRTT
ncbi:hypothetical protein NXH56_09050, partial [Bifidobacterium thermophilum]|nr:hypothetical protein [Bifidobacterium thermophilum]